MSDNADDTLTPGEVAVRMNQFARMAATHHTCGGALGCVACSVDIHARFAGLEARVAAAERERDLAIAHDRQPYPTAWAYEQVCAVLSTTKERLVAAKKRAEEAERRVAEADESLQTVARVVTGMGADLSTANAEIERLKVGADWLSRLTDGYIKYGSESAPLAYFYDTVFPGELANILAKAREAHEAAKESK